MDPKDEEYTTLAWYGLDVDAERLEKAYRLAVDLITQNVRVPDRAAVVAPGFSGRWISFAGAHKRLEKLGFAGVKSIDLVTLLPDARVPVADYEASLCFSVKNRHVCIALRSAAVPIGGAELLDFSRRFGTQLRAPYGYGHLRELSKGPIFYAIGINCGERNWGDPEEYAVALRVSRWGDAVQDRVWEAGMVRDIYPWNFLTEPHLERRLGGVSLRAWIEADPGRGELSPMPEGVLLWRVEPADILAVRTAAVEAGLITHWCV